MIKSVFWDLDETLVYNTAFVEVRAEFAQTMVSEGFDYTEADNLMELVDSTAVRIYGFSDLTRFGRSMISVYQMLATKYNQVIHPDVEHILTDLAKTVYTRPTHEMPGASQAIFDARVKGYKSYVVTKGSQDIQTKKITSLGLDKYIEDIFVFSEKTLHEMYQVLSKTNSSSRSSYFVGNSPKSDVNPAHLSGMTALYIPHPITWKAELEPLLDGVITVDNINQISKLLR